MDENTKWKRLNEYLKGKDEQLLSEFRANARQEALGDLPRISAQMALLEDIVAQAERLDQDHDIKVFGRLAPPKHQY